MAAHNIGLGELILLPLLLVEDAAGGGVEGVQPRPLLLSVLPNDESIIIIIM
jgi:hypothetical protein